MSDVICNPGFIVVFCSTALLIGFSSVGGCLSAYWEEIAKQPAYPTQGICPLDVSESGDLESDESVTSQQCSSQTENPDGRPKLASNPVEHPVPTQPAQQVEQKNQELEENPDGQPKPASNPVEQPVPTQPTQQVEQKNQELQKAELFGLRNMGSTCYLNSAVQCILHVSPVLPAFLAQHSETNITGKLHKLLECRGSGIADFVRALQAELEDTMYLYEQNDPNLLITSLLGIIEKECDTKIFEFAFDTFDDDPEDSWASYKLVIRNPDKKTSLQTILSQMRDPFHYKSIPNCVTIAINYVNDFESRIIVDEQLDLSFLVEGQHLYELCGVIVHSGSSWTSGHYVANLKTNDGWVMLNDSSVASLSFKNTAQYLEYLEKNKPSTLFFKRLKL